MSRAFLTLSRGSRNLTFKISQALSKNDKRMLSVLSQTTLFQNRTHLFNSSHKNYPKLYNQLFCNFSEAKINEDSSTETQENSSQQPNKNTSQNENEDNTDESESEYETDDEDDSSQIEDLRQQIQDLEADRDKFRNALARTQADFVNYERMAAKDVKQAKDFALKKFSGDILSVADAIESCMKLFDDNEKFHLDFENEEHKDIKQIYDGINLTHKALLESFKRNGIEQFESLNQPFDPDRHEALFNVPTDKEEDNNKVVRVISEGYTINEHILRPAKVGVATSQ